MKSNSRRERLRSFPNSEEGAREIPLLFFSKNSCQFQDKEDVESHGCLCNEEAEYL